MTLARRPTLCLMRSRWCLHDDEETPEGDFAGIADIRRKWTSVFDDDSS